MRCPEIFWQDIDFGPLHHQCFNWIKRNRQVTIGCYRELRWSNTEADKCFTIYQLPTNFSVGFPFPSYILQKYWINVHVAAIQTAQRSYFGHCYSVTSFLPSTNKGGKAPGKYFHRLKCIFRWNNRKNWMHKYEKTLNRENVSQKHKRIIVHLFSHINFV